MLVRGALHLPAAPRRARLHATAHGLYEAWINGAAVGDQVLAPGWTSYHRRLRYQTYDVTGLLREGENAIGAWLAEGWYRGRLGFHGGTREIYGPDVGFLGQLEVECADGSAVRSGTDGSWCWYPSPTLSASLYDGESYDARQEVPGWSEPGLDTAGWRPVRVLQRDPATLVAPLGPPVRRVEEVRPAAISTTEDGRALLDFGQNLVGRLRVHAPHRADLVLRHAEVLQDGELCTRPLRRAEATDRCLPDGEWEPRFTFHGFRYAEITGWPGTPSRDQVAAQVLHTDMRRTGWFETSDPLLNRLHDNVVWSMRGNFLDLPTDCPQRDERLGWTGDIQVFAPTASFLFDCAGLLTSWLADLAAEQHSDGTVPFIVPTIPAPGWTPPWAAAVWGDVAVLTPWTLHERFGDRGVLAAQYPSARAWVELVHSQLDEDGLWRRGKQLGDWLDPAAPPEDPFQARTDPHLVASAYFVRSADVLARTAAELGEDADRDRYAAMARRARAAFAAVHVGEDGALSSDTQAAYALALHFGLLPTAELRAAAARRLRDLVVAADHTIATGFAGTPVICDALADNGYPETAYRLLLGQRCPSWLYPVVQGATTIWERWDSLLPDGSVNPGEMTSFNHYALGAVADWLHRRVAGLAPAAPGYRRLRVAPLPGGGLTSARARHLTPYGPAEVAWRRAGEELHVDVVVPPGTTAEVALPGTAPAELGSGSHRVTAPWRVVG
ncbi:family 78 glycoside hydrolase catalytic domain [Saccharopolyspora sp. CA-218241]|uniref:family 78 glycoside hydrolase catalytic domain n=1 Tax=Saccharopolyspora sp. CA-218241 TaxID=3240027 RepID=UPI003D9686F2